MLLRRPQSISYRKDYTLLYAFIVATVVVAAGGVLLVARKRLPETTEKKERGRAKLRRSM